MLIGIMQPNLHKELCIVCYADWDYAAESKLSYIVITIQNGRQLLCPVIVDTESETKS